MPPLLQVSTSLFHSLPHAYQGSAAAAARINASLQARKGIQHVDVPPIQGSNSSDIPKAPTPTNARSGADHGPVLTGEMYVADGDYIQDIEVNDLRNRYVVTKGSAQKQVNIFYIPLIFPVSSRVVASSSCSHAHQLAVIS